MQPKVSKKLRMKLIDNINQLLGDDLKKAIQPGARLKIAASCFSIYAYEALKSELETVDSMDFIFTAPSFKSSFINCNALIIYLSVVATSA